MASTAMLQVESFLLFLGHNTVYFILEQRTGMVTKRVLSEAAFSITSF